MTRFELLQRLAEEEIVPLTAAEWQEVRDAFEVVERHPTLLAGELVVVHSDAGLLAVEEPRAGERVVRRLGDAAAMRAFVKERLDTYERMWDGCGCKVDYYHR